MSRSTFAKAIVILDFGGQYAHLIASRVRRFGYTSYIASSDIDPMLLADAAGIILSGGPQSVYEEGSPQADPRILSLGIPVLGLCYGHQWLAQAAGGAVRPARVKEYGPTALHVVHPQDSLFQGLPTSLQVWMSHGDEVAELPSGFVTVASTRDCQNAAIMDPARQLYGIQCHIEVTHTEHGMDLLRSFVQRCNPLPWKTEGYKDRIAEDIRREVGDRRVFMLVSGGVDSTVAFVLLNAVLGADRVQGLLVDTGLMRKNEVAAIQEAFAPLGIRNLRVVDASATFFTALKDVYEPERKRAIIGETFLSVQRNISEEMGLSAEKGWMLGQGTIYPDTIETGGTKHAATIKTHHNRVPMVEDLIRRGLVIEPLKELYKDEVRALGEELGLPHHLVWRHPFPGPGLGVRILCAQKPILPSSLKRQDGVPSMILPVKSVGVQGDGRTYRHPLALFSSTPCDVPEHHRSLATSIPNADRTVNRVVQCLSHSAPFPMTFTPTMLERRVADILREADDIVMRTIDAAGLTARIWQFPVVLLPCGTTEGGYAVVLRPIDSMDAMTASSYVLPQQVLTEITTKLREIPHVDAVFYDLTHKPPGTIEWE